MATTPQKEEIVITDEAIHYGLPQNFMDNGSAVLKVTNNLDTTIDAWVEKTTFDDKNVDEGIPTTPISVGVGETKYIEITEPWSYLKPGVQSTGGVPSSGSVVLVWTFKARSGEGLEVDLSLYQLLSEKNQVDGYAGLGGDGKINSAQVPAIAITNTFVVANETEQLALTIQIGDIAIRTDEGKSYINTTGNNTSMADWEWLQSPTDAVQSVQGRTGVVTLDDLFVLLAGKAGGQAIHGGTLTNQDLWLYDNLVDKQRFLWFNSSGNKMHFQVPTTGSIQFWFGNGLATQKFNMSATLFSISMNASFNGTLNMVGHAINSVLDPVLAQDAATKKYVDDKPSLYQFGNGDDVLDNQTVYFNSFGTYTVLAHGETRFPKGKAVRLTINVVGNIINQIIPFVLLKNGTPTGLTITFAATEVARKTVAVDVAIADGDLLTVRAIIPDDIGTKSFQPRDIILEFRGEA